MKKTIVAILVLGLMAAACQNPSGGGGSSNDVPSSGVPSSGGPSSSGLDTSLNGSWGATFDGDHPVMKFNNGNFEASLDGVLTSKGIYSTSSGKLTTTVTHVHGSNLGLESKWYSKADLEKVNISMSNQLDWEANTADYIINGNKVTFTKNGVSVTYTRQ